MFGHRNSLQRKDSILVYDINNLLNRLAAHFSDTERNKVNISCCIAYINIIYVPY